MATRHSTFSSATVGLAVAALAAAAGCAPGPDARLGWDVSELQGGWRAEQMIDAPVYGAHGEAIGEVAEIIVGPDDRVEAIVVEAGGALDVGDVHFRVPWHQVGLTPGTAGVRVPIDQDSVAEFSLFGDEVETRPRAWRVGEVLGDYVRLADGEDFGIVDDLVFSQAGELQAVVVNPDIGYGVGRSFAYPWPGYEVVDPGPDVLDVPYTWEQTGELPPFDYEMYDDVF